METTPQGSATEDFLDDSQRRRAAAANCLDIAGEAFAARHLSVAEEKQVFLAEAVRALQHWEHVAEPLATEVGKRQCLLCVVWSCLT